MRLKRTILVLLAVFLLACVAQADDDVVNGGFTILRVYLGKDPNFNCQVFFVELRNDNKRNFDNVGATAKVKDSEGFTRINICGFKERVRAGERFTIKLAYDTDKDRLNPRIEPGWTAVITSVYGWNN